MPDKATCGLATGALLKNDLGKHEIIDGKIKVADVVPDGEVNSSRLTWWQDRIRNTFSAGVKAGWNW